MLLCIKEAKDAKATTSPSEAHLARSAPRSVAGFASLEESRHSPEKEEDILLEDLPGMQERRHWLSLVWLWVWALGLGVFGLQLAATSLLVHNATVGVSSTASCKASCKESDSFRSGNLSENLAARTHSQLAAGGQQFCTRLPPKRSLCLLMLTMRFDGRRILEDELKQTRFTSIGTKLWQKKDPSTAGREPFTCVFDPERAHGALVAIQRCVMPMMMFFRLWVRFRHSICKKESNPLIRQLSRRLLAIHAKGEPPHFHPLPRPELESS